MTPASGAGSTVVCPLCGAASPAGALSCAACNGLIHAAELKQLTTEAQAAEQAGQTTEALRLWREALDLLPPATVQRQTVWEKVQALSLQVDREPAPASAPPAKSPWMRRLGPFAAVALLVWKFKALVFVALTKGKVLLLGLTKLSTLSTMVLSLGAYWALYGWKFALGLVLSIYVHEMGHVHELRRFGIKASAPAFIPLLGAVVRMKQYPANPREDARVGLAGPRWGTWGAAATFVLYFWTQLPIYGVIAHFAAWINLFNLLPVWQLDGSRAFHALGRGQRGLAVIAIAAAWAATREGFLLILMALAIRRLFTRDYPPEGDRRALVEYAGLVAVLAAMLIVPVPVAK